MDADHQIEALKHAQEHAIDTQGTGYFTYLVSLSLEDEDSILDENGVPSWVDYTKINWKGLAKDINQLIADQIPKSIKVFVGDEPLNIIDSVVEETFDRRSTMGDRLSYVYNNLSPEDYRASVINLSQHRKSLHPHCTPAEKSPPVAGLFIAIKCRLMQILDYESDFTELFGYCPVLGIRGPGEKNIQKIRVAQPDLMAIINRHLGYVYSDDCIMVRLGWKPIPRGR